MHQMHLLLISTAYLPDYYGRLMAFTNSQIKTYFFFVTNYGILMFLASGTHLKFNSSLCTHFMKDAIPLHMLIFNPYSHSVSQCCFGVSSPEMYFLTSIIGTGPIECVSNVSTCMLFYSSC